MVYPYISATVSFRMDLHFIRVMGHGFDDFNSSKQLQLIQCSNALSIRISIDGSHIIFCNDIIHMLTIPRTCVLNFR